MAEEVGRVSIRVLPDLKGFRKKVEAEINRLKDQEVEVHGNTEPLEREIEKATKDKKATIDIESDIDSGDLKAKAAAAATAASGHTVKFRTSLDGKKLLRDALLTSKGIQNLLSQKPWKFKADTLSLRTAIADVGQFSFSMDKLKAQIGEVRHNADLFKEAFAEWKDTVTYPPFGKFAKESFGEARQALGKYRKDFSSTLAEIRGRIGGLTKLPGIGVDEAGIVTMKREFLGMRAIAAGTEIQFKRIGQSIRKLSLKPITSQLQDGISSAYLFQREIRKATTPVRMVGQGIKILSKSFTSTLTPVKSAMNSLRGFASHAMAASIAMAGMVGSALGIQGAIVGLGGIIGYVVDGVKQLSGVLAFIPGILGGLGLLGASAFTAFRGMGSALSAALDPAADLNEAISDLTPNAQSFARSVRGLVAPWSEVRKSVQDITFAGLGDELTAMSEKQLPTIHTGMNQVAESMNFVMKSFASFAKSDRTTKALASGFESVRGITTAFGEAIDDVLLGLQDMGVAGLEVLDEMSSGWGKTAQKFSDWTAIDKNRQKMKQWMRDGVQGFKDLGSTVGNLYKSFKTIGNAFGVDFDKSAIASFEDFTARFNNWLGSADDANSRISIFADKVKSITAPWIDTFQNAFSKLTPAFKELSPLLEEISTQFADNLSSIIDWAAPKLEGFFKFISDNKGIFGTLAAGLLTLRTALGLFTLGRMLVAPYIGAIGALAGAANKTYSAIRGDSGKTAAKVSKDAKGIGQSTTVIADGPGKKGKGKRNLFGSLSRDSSKAAADVDKASKKVSRSTGRMGKLGAIKRIGSSFKSAGKSATSFASNTAKGLGKATKGIGKFAGTAGKFLGKGLARLIPGLGAALMAWDIGSLIFNNWDTISAKAQEIFSNIGNWIGRVWDAIPGWWSGVWDSIVSWLQGLWQGVVDWALGLWNGFTSWIGNIWTNVSEWWSGVWDGIISWLQGLWQGVVDWALGLWNGFTSWLGNIWTNVSEWWSGLWEGIISWLQGLWQGIVDWALGLWNGFTEWIGNIWTGVLEWWTGIWTGIVAWIQGIWQGIVSFGTSVWNGIVTVLSTIWNGVQAAWSAVWNLIVSIVTAIWNSLKSAASSAFSGIGNIVSGAWNMISGVTSAVWNGIKSVISGAWNAITSFISSGISSAVSFISSGFSSMVSFVTSSMSSFASAISNGISRAVSFISSLPGKAKSALGDLGSLLLDSGKALIQGFINGIKSMVGAVTDAASNVIGAVRDFFPFSPAKRGPLSGKGYTTYSGKALAKDFALGMLSGKTSVADAAKDITSAAHDALQAPARSMEEFHRAKIRDEVLKKNAEKIAKARKDQAKAEAESAKKIEEINRSTKSQADKEKEIAKIREDLIKKREEGYKDLEVPDYSKIKRSINDYWIDGTKDLLRKNLERDLEAMKFAERTRVAVSDALDSARRVVGNHPVFDQVSRSINAEHFQESIQKAIMDSGIAEVPVELAISNLDKFKDDLGMGNGVISRAIDEWMKYDASESNARRAKSDNGSKTEVHYHVEDMNEAIRLEQLRERKQLMRVR